MKLLLIAGLILLSSASYAAPSIERMNYFHEIPGRSESLYDVYHRSAGGYYACGYTDSRQWLLRLEENSQPVWSAVFDRGSLRSNIETDRGEVLAGGSFDGSFGALLVTVDEEVVWGNTYISGGCNSVIELKNNMFALGGSGESAPYVTMIDTDGEVIWATRLHGFNNYNAKVEGIRETEGGIVAAGTINYGNGHLGAGLLFKLNFEGELLWQRVFDNRRGDGIYSIVSRGNGGFALLCKRYGDNDGEWWDESAFSLILTDSEGNLESQTHYPSGRTISDGPMSIARLSDGGFVMCGLSIAFRSPWAHYPILIRTDSEGRLIWRERFVELVEEGPQDRSLYRWLMSVIVQGQDRIVGVGTMYHDDGGACADGWFVRLFPDQPGPFLFYKSPEDSALHVLQGDSIRFVAQARNRDNAEILYQWIFENRHISEDTAVTIGFDSLGVFPVRCMISDRDATIFVDWSVTVHDLIVSAFTPDTLSLTIRRGESVDFSLDTVRAVEGDPIEYFWLKRNVDIGDEVDTVGLESDATVPFLQSGHYRIDGMAYRGESSDNISWDVSVRGAIWAFAPEVLAFEVLPDSTVSFIVEPTFPDAEGQTIRWLIDGEVAAEDTTLFNWSFGEADSCPPHLVQVVVADTIESDTVTWTVTVVEPDFVRDDDFGQAGTPVLLTVSPNPFNSTLTITFPKGIPPSIEGGRGGLALCIYDISGRLVVDLSNSPFRNPHSAFGRVIWDASSIPAGVYFVRLHSGNVVATKKVVLMR